MAYEGYYELPPEEAPRTWGEEVIIEVGEPGEPERYFSPGGARQVLIPDAPTDTEITRQPIIPEMAVVPGAEVPPSVVEPSVPTYFGYTARQLAFRGIRLGIYGAMGYLVTRVLAPKYSLLGIPVGVGAGYGVERIVA